MQLAQGLRMFQPSDITAKSFEELAAIAIHELKNRNKKVGMVCGPITTGGTGEVSYNTQIFNAVIGGLCADSEALFIQIPYEFCLNELREAWFAAGNIGYCMPILEEFYARIFESGHIDKGFFIPGWHTSQGTQWERGKFQELGIPFRDLSLEEVRQFLLPHHPSEHVAEIMHLMQIN